MYVKGADAQIVENDRTAADLPPEAPLAMPRQDFFSKEAPSAPRPHYGCEPETILLRRSMLIGTAIVMTTMATVTLGASLPVHSAILVKIAFLGVFTLLFGWLSFAFLTCLAGIWRMLVDHEDERLGLTDHTPLEELNTMTALLAPVYNENPVDVTRRLLAMDSALAQRGAARNFHIFILSDSNNPDVIDREYEAFLELRARAFRGAERIFYRRRTENLERKSGNIADWVRRFGGAYDGMITLDADSVMSAETMIRLAAAMERHQEVGLIQTTPRLIGRRSLFGRIEQFSHSLYGPLLTQGMTWWSGAEANYYGHNAIIRTRAFAENAGLPVLPGRRPFGGSVLSHDFVEAALIRRGGWAVLHAPSLGGSYEECPPTLDDYLDRDRRWCQGNVQHMGVLGARGLHWINRIHLAFGAAAYFTAPLWLAFIALSLFVRSAEPLDMRSIYDFNPHEGTHDIGAVLVYFACMTLLFAPKLIAFVLAMRDENLKKGFGGPVATLSGIAVQSVFSAMLAPVFMWTQTRAVCGILTGRDSGWKSQSRGERGMRMGAAAKRYRTHVILAVVLFFACLAATPHDLSGANMSTITFMAPVLIGLALAAPLGSFTARSDVGDALRRMGILCTPEETNPPRVLVMASPDLYTDIVGANREDSFQPMGGWLGEPQMQLALAKTAEPSNAPAHLE